jgi:hypothetical protein
MEGDARPARFSPALSLALFLAAAAGLSQGGPPFVTDDPGTPGNRRWEINLAFTFEARGPERTFETPLLDANYGLGDRVQLKVEVPWVVRRAEGGETDQGAGNVLLGVKWRFSEVAKNGVSIATYPQVEINTSLSSARKGLAEKETGLLLPLLFQRQLGPVLANVEIGHLFRRGRKGEWIFGLALGHEFSEKVEVAAEIFATTSSRLADPVSIWNLGARWKAAEHAILLVAAGSGVSGTSEEPRARFQSYVGVQLTF